MINSDLCFCFSDGTLDLPKYEGYVHEVMTVFIAQVMDFHFSKK